MSTILTLCIFTAATTVDLSRRKAAAACEEILPDKTSAAVNESQQQALSLSVSLHCSHIDML